MVGESISTMKNGMAAGLSAVITEMIKAAGKAVEDMFNK